MTGLGANRRVHHRQVVADTIRRLRGEKGWTQDELAERLKIDRRQVVRFEAAQVPVTLEMVEALSLAFKTPSLVFMISTVDEATIDESTVSLLVQRLAESEMRSRFGAAIDRPDVQAIVHNLQLLDEEHLWTLLVIADALVKARHLEQWEADEWPSLIQARFGRTPRNRRRSNAKTGKR